MSVFLSPASFNIPRFILVAASVRLLLFYPPLTSLTLRYRLPLVSLSFFLSQSVESQKKGQNFATYLSLSVSPATLWASLDIRENARTGVRGNPAATWGVDRDDDDDDKLPAGKALRRVAGVEKARTRETEGWATRRGSGRPTERRKREREREEVREGGRGDCVARQSGRGGESTNEETNALRSKEHACDAALENVVKRNGDRMTKGTEL